MVNVEPSRTFIFRSERATFDWPGGRGIDVAEVRVVLNDLALHFSAPIVLDGNTLALILASGDLGPLTVVAEIIEERDLTDAEVEELGFSLQPLVLVIGRTVDLKSAKSFVRKVFPPWALVYFYDEHSSGRPSIEPYRGPSSGSNEGG